jgi:hypothetical protein
MASGAIRESALGKVGDGVDLSEERTECGLLSFRLEDRFSTLWEGGVLRRV